MVSRGPSAWGLLLGVAWVLPGCATQHDTAQALTIAGAAAVVIGASMAADEQCYDAGAGEGGVQAYCAPGLSKGARTAGKGMAVAGVGLAAAGYALKPKGPDRLQRAPADPDAVRFAPYRLIRQEPAPAPPETPALVPAPEAPAAEGTSPEVAPCASGTAAAASKADASCAAAPAAASGGAAPGTPSAVPAMPSEAPASPR